MHSNTTLNTQCECVCETKPYFFFIYIYISTTIAHNSIVCGGGERPKGCCPFLSLSSVQNGLLYLKKRHKTNGSTTTTTGNMCVHRCGVVQCGAFVMSHFSPFLIANE